MNDAMGFISSPLSIFAFINEGYGVLGCILSIIALAGVGWVLLKFFEAIGEAGQEDAARIARGERPKYGPPPFGPDNPFKKK